MSENYNIIMWVLKPIIPLLTFIIVYKIILYLSNLIDLSSYYYETKKSPLKEDLNNYKVIWFNAGETNGKSSVYYRFKVIYGEKSFLIFLNKREINFLIKIKLIFWGIKEYYFNKVDKLIKGNGRNKILPDFLIDSYIIPKITERTYVEGKNV